MTARKAKKLTEGYAESPEVEAERAEIRLAMAFAKAVYDRRMELGLSQAEGTEPSGSRGSALPQGRAASPAQLSVRSAAASYADSSSNRSPSTFAAH
ncbi:transcriptional regulator [Streptomyces sp. NPDC002896]|uniref:transcriptional regulator n=1 Tax=Streptomyces sp. NPDC002896 TaxID=3154438 RepID=UPI0033222C14